MLLRKILILIFTSITTLIVSQNEVCESSSNFDIMMELNNIEKCYHNNQSTDINENDTSISTRSRYIRTKKNLHITAIKNSLNTTKSEIEVIDKPKPLETIKPKYIKLKNLTEVPVLLTIKGASDYREDLREALNVYIDKNLVYPENVKRKGIEGIVWASFIINTKGIVQDVVTSGPINGEVFEIETERLIKALPYFIPGKLNGEYVNVKYLMTVNFKLSK